MTVQPLAVRSSLAMNASQRAITCCRLSPPGQPSLNSSHPGWRSSICAEVNPS